MIRRLLGSIATIPESAQSRAYKCEKTVLYAVHQPQKNAIISVSKTTIDNFNTETTEKRWSSQLESAICAEYNPDLGVILTGNSDSTIRVYESSTGALRMKLPETPIDNDGRRLGHTGAVLCLLYVSPDEILSGGVDGTVKLWSLSSKEVVRTFLPTLMDNAAITGDNGIPAVQPAAIAALAYDSQRKIVCAGHINGIIRQYDLLSGKMLLELRICSSNNNNNNNSCNSNSNVNSNNNNVANATKAIATGSTEASVISMAILTKWDLLVFSNTDSTFRVWDLRGGSELYRYRFCATSILYDEERDVLFTGAEDGHIVLWKCILKDDGNRALHILRKEVQQHTKKIASLWYHPDADALVTSSEDGSVRLFPRIIETALNNPAVQEVLMRSSANSERRDASANANAAPKLTKEEVEESVKQLKARGLINYPSFPKVDSEKQLFALVIQALYDAESASSKTGNSDSNKSNINNQSLKMTKLQEGLVEAVLQLQKACDDIANEFAQKKEVIATKYSSILDPEGDPVIAQIQSTYERELEKMLQRHKAELEALKQRFEDQKNKHRSQAPPLSLEQAAEEYMALKGNYQRQVDDIENKIASHLRWLLLETLRIPVLYQQPTQSPTRQRSSLIATAVSTTFSDRYKIVNPISDGLIAVPSTKVFRGIDLEEKELVAIKVLPARIEISLDIFHETIVPVRDVCYSDTNTYIIMELMRENLASYVKHQPQQELPEHIVAEFIYTLLQSLDYLHQNGMVHRDLRPENILVTNDDRIKLIHVGLMKSLTGMEKDEDGFVYAAPELFGRTVTTESDMWSLGCVFAFLLQTAEERKEPLFRGKDAGSVLQSMIEVIQCPPNEEIEEFIAESQMKKQFAKVFKDHIMDKPDEEKQIKTPLSQRISRASPEALDLLERLLEFNPKKRISEKDALLHPYFEKFMDHERGHSDVSVTLEQEEEEEEPREDLGQQQQQQPDANANANATMPTAVL